MTTGTGPLWFLAPDIAAVTPGLAPHLIATAPTADPAAALLAHLRPPSCQHTWG